jgi:hypothetical protein
MTYLLALFTILGVHFTASTVKTYLESPEGQLQLYTWGVSAKQVLDDISGYFTGEEK